MHDLKSIAEKIERHAKEPYPQWVEPGVYYVSLASEIEAAMQAAISEIIAAVREKLKS